MPFDPSTYDPTLAVMLSGDNKERLMPLVRSDPPQPDLRSQIADVPTPATRAALYLYFGFWNEAHEIAQDLSTPEGNYLHALVHRQEPDSGNANYWFARVGEHPIFAELSLQAAALGFDCGGPWDPAEFVEFCEEARRKPGSGEEVCALEVQRAEWRLLFDYCATQRL